MGNQAGVGGGRAVVVMQAVGGDGGWEAVVMIGSGNEERTTDYGDYVHLPFHLAFARYRPIALCLTLQSQRIYSTWRRVAVAINCRWAEDDELTTAPTIETF